MAKSSAQLQKMRKNLPSDTPEANKVRLHRAISWFARAEKESKDPDVQFILLWISFNALYAEDLSDFDSTFHGHANDFFRKLVDIDSEKLLHNLIWTSFSQSVRTLLDNEYAYKGFWNSVRSGDVSRHWEKSFEQDNRRALVGLREGLTAVVLEVVFGRLYILRNQLVHGGATHSSKVNRDQIKDGARILSAVIPVMIELMLTRADEDYGKITYPVINY